MSVQFGPRSNAITFPVIPFVIGATLLTPVLMVALTRDDLQIELDAFARGALRDTLVDVLARHGSGASERNILVYPYIVVLHRSLLFPPRNHDGDLPLVSPDFSNTH